MVFSVKVSLHFLFLKVVQAAETDSEKLIKDRNPWKVIKSSADTPGSKFLVEELWKLKDLVLALNTATT